MPIVSMAAIALIISIITAAGRDNLLTIGIAFSFQRYNKLPTSKNDAKLDYILTEKGLI